MLTNLIGALGFPELLVPIARVVVPAGGGSPVASVDFAWTQDFEDVIFHYANVVPVTDDVELHGRTSNDAGATYDSGAADYTVVTAVYQTGFGTDLSSGAPYMIVAGESSAGNGLGNETLEGASGFVAIHRPFDVASYTRLHGWGGYNASVVANEYMSQCFGHRNAAERCDGFQFYFSAGNIAEGVFEARGVLPVERAA